MTSTRSATVRPMAYEQGRKLSQHRPVTGASVAMRPVVDATVGLSFGWFVAFGLIGAIGDVPGMTARDALLPAVCKKDGVDMRRFVGVSQSAESLVAVVGPSAAAERAVS